ncbi:MAG: hypothetical protein ABII01_03020 [Candidatus Woesearchaeota archaeon]
MRQKEFFRYPERKYQILGGRTMIPLRTDDLVDQLQYLSRNPDKAGVLDYDQEPTLVPETFNDWNDFMKHSPPVRMRVYRSMAHANADQTPLWMQRQEKFELLEPDQHPSGILWMGLGRKKVPRKYNLVHCVEAAKILGRSIHSASRIDKIRINSYGPLGMRDYEGSKNIVSMHSRSDGFQYPPFRLVNVPVERNGTEYALILDIDHNHNCGQTTNLETHFQSNSPHRMYSIQFCPHVIAGYWELMRQAIRSVPRNETPMAMNPFALPSTLALDTYSAARYQTMVWDNYLDSEGAVHHQHRPLREAELEVVLFDLQKQYADKKPFFATRQDNYARYNWNRLRN